MPQTMFINDGWLVSSSKQMVELELDGDNRRSSIRSSVVSLVAKDDLCRSYDGEDLGFWCSLEWF